jgi:hypothetical protein
MSIVVTLSPELEEQLREKAVRQGQDINLVQPNFWRVFLNGKHKIQQKR